MKIRFHVVDNDWHFKGGAFPHIDCFGHFGNKIRINEHSECGRGADLSTALVEIATSLPDLENLFSGMKITKELISDLFLYEELIRRSLKMLQKRSVSVIMPRESVNLSTLIYLIKKYNRFFNKVEEIWLIAITDYQDFLEQFDMVKLRSDIPDNDLEIQDHRVHLFVYKIKRKNDYLTSLITVNRAGEILSCVEI